MIANRPSVLAHERFVADRDNFASLDLAGRFERIEQTNLWGAATSVSGLGSEDPATAAIREALPLLLQRVGARSLLDAPCGDAGWVGQMKLGLDYTGIDIVPSLIAANNERAARGDLSGRFLVADITRDALPRADVVLCRDCLVHLSFDNIIRAVDRFRTSGARFLLATTFPEWDGNFDCEDGDWRALNMEKAPFDWPAPRALINER
jgi:2-polyprenyl-3-methyl-5-hydroxy-6-metoxy-1,4-benzoquinol methylase